MYAFFHFIPVNTSGNRMPQEEIVVIGRITHDSDSEGTAKLTEMTMSLESSRMLAGGARVPLRFDPNVKIRGGPLGVGGVGLFPGAIIALKGKNGGTGSFLATEILSVIAASYRSGRFNNSQSFSRFRP
jgi:DNA polymerase alpha subunit B